MARDSKLSSSANNQSGSDASKRHEDSASSSSVPRNNESASVGKVENPGKLSQSPESDSLNLPEQGNVDESDVAAPLKGAAVGDKPSRRGPTSAEKAGASNVGTTSSKTVSDEEVGHRKSSGVAKKVAQGAAATSAPGTVGGGMLLGLLMGIRAFLSTAFGAAVGAAQSFFSGFVTFVTGAASAIAGMFGTVGSAIIGGAAAAGSLVIAGLLVAGTIAAGDNIAARDGYIEDCGTGVDAAQEIFDAAGDPDAMAMANAQKINSVFATQGVDKVRISGMLGNLDAESGFDPTSVEAAYHFMPNEPRFVWTAKKEELISSSAFDSYSRQACAFHNGYLPGYLADDGKAYCGLGLAGWTGGNVQPLFATAASVGRNWYDLDLQIAYLADDGHYRAGFWKTWMSESAPASPEAAAIYFSHNYEGNTIAAMERRQENAAKWYVYVNEWSVDANYGNSILALAAQMSNAAMETFITDEKSTCAKKREGYDNSSMASAAVSFAYPKAEQGWYNNGTELWQKVYEGIFPGDGHYMDCGRTVATAVRWSGSDDDYPVGPTSTQHSHMLSSPKWEVVSASSVEDLQPGDIINKGGSGGSGHTLMFVGHELIAQIHGEENVDANSNTVSGSMDERSPGCDSSSTSYVLDSAFTVFRCVQPDHSTTYASVGL